MGIALNFLGLALDFPGVALDFPGFALNFPGFAYCSREVLLRTSISLLMILLGVDGFFCQCAE